MTGTPPQPPSKADLLARATESVEREDADARAATARPVRRRQAMAMTLWVLAIANVVLWVVFPPAGPDDADQRTPAAMENDLRLVVAGAAAEIEDWRLANAGRLPGSLGDVGLTELTGVEYARLDSARFELRGTDGALRVTYDSRTPISEFVSAGIGARP